jgi:alkylation response protein AidB-like acyl-CoA dehydrogenase
VDRARWAGLLGVHLPEEYGGGGGGMQEAVTVVEELAAHGLPMLSCVISPAMVGSLLAAHGSGALKAQWLPGIADGSKKVAFGLTEPDAGSNSHEVSTSAKRDGDGWRISGSKYYISAVDQADAILLVVRDAEFSTPEKKKLSMFVIPIDAEGLSYQKIPTSIVSPDRQFSVFLDDVYAGPETLVGQLGQGLRQAFAALNPERILVGAITGGVGRYSIAKATDYVLVVHDQLAVTGHARCPPTARGTNTRRQDTPPRLSTRVRWCACTRGGTPLSPSLIASLSRRGRVAAGIEGCGFGRGR